MDKKRLKILNLFIDTYNMDEAVKIIDNFIKIGNRPHSVFAANPEKNFSLLNDKTLHETFLSADLLIPDGIGMVLAAKMLKKKKITRVPGVELMGQICKLSQKNGYEIFVYGANEDVNKKAVKNLRNKYNGIKIVGRANGYIETAHMGRLIKQINDSKAKILFLALGSPRQEKWFSDYKDQLSTISLCQGIGGSLDVIAGNVKRAPKWWRKNNLEWLYRLIKEPKRIQRQKVLPKFVFNLIVQKLKNQKEDIFFKDV
jgi:N-acetylglucosaminyldiphosphoundecaprenol N-acetyl-beta-D-mannosaminyltransferase